MKVHIFTLNWNGADKLEKLQPDFGPGLLNNLDQLHIWKKLEGGGRDLVEAVEYEWYIRDNGSTDKSIDLIDKWNTYDWLFPIKKFNIGHNRDNFAQGMNFLFDEANPADDDLILLLNNDVEFGDDTSLLKMHNLMKKTGAGIVGARLLYPGTNKLQHAGVIFSERYNKMPYHYRPNEESDKNAEKNRYFQSVTAAVMLIKASSFRKVNGFDPYLNWAFDDTDLTLRIGQAGEKIAYCGGTKIFHTESASLKLNPVNKLFLTQNVLRFRQKWDGKYKIDHDLYLKDPNYNVIP
jgi:GT2 family glycosyltransferase